MPSKFLKHEACPECKSKNNLARYDDGHATCFGCGYQEQPKKDKAEPRMDMSAVVETFLTMARLPLSANILFTTVMATNMPFVGRG